MLGKLILSIVLALAIALASIFAALFGDNETMANPQPYNKSTDFVALSGSDNSAQLNNEFNKVAASLNAIVENLVLIQRDDTQLANNSVHVESLRADVYRLLSNFNPRGSWSAGISYAVGDIVTFGSSSYAAIQAHTSTASFETDLGNDLLMIISNPVTLTQVVEELYSNPTTISDFQSLFDILEQVYLLLDEIVAVNANATNINLNVSNSTNINIVAGLSSAINSLAAIESELLSIEGSKTELLALEENLTDILLAVSGLTMTNNKLTLIVDGNAAVAGVSYPDVATAVWYALGVMQAGGTLTVTVAENLTINEIGPIDFSYFPFNVTVIGQSSSTSILSYSSAVVTPLTVGGHTVKYKDIKLTRETNNFFEIDNGTLIFENVDCEITIDGGYTGITVNNGRFIADGDSSVTAPKYGIVSTASRVDLGSTFQLATFGTSSAKRGIDADNASTIYAEDVIINNIGTTGQVGVRAQHGTIVHGSGLTVTDIDGGVGGFTTKFDPAIDTFDNHYSRIITAI